MPPVGSGICCFVSCYVGLYMMAVCGWQLNTCCKEPEASPPSVLILLIPMVYIWYFLVETRRGV
ncbi:hypothetical protein I7I53_10985 [Histoplasma capsulatum var. duboisii H88]|uniref:Uncharacterized protein n=1 Tax=Ajellomyces capsulatus (strain H88) TaxID=544711 RepID=A0A8A1LCZ8_AJEC8|nr:hypothetical protein I7I53_10985 [Histoplasma capsulatum var. duboisii H88]